MFYEKDKAIFHVYEYMETNQAEHSQLAKEYLTKLASKYHVRLKKPPIKKPSIKPAFKAFILNENGVEDIQQLYNALS